MSYLSTLAEAYTAFPWLLSYTTPLYVYKLTAAATYFSIQATIVNDTPLMLFSFVPTTHVDDSHRTGHLSVATCKRIFTALRMCVSACYRVRTADTAPEIGHPDSHVDCSRAYQVARIRYP